MANEAHCIVVTSSSNLLSRSDEHMIRRLTSRMTDAYFEALLPEGRQCAAALHTLLHKIEVCSFIAKASIARQALAASFDLQKV